MKNSFATLLVVTLSFAFQCTIFAADSKTDVKLEPIRIVGGNSGVRILKERQTEIEKATGAKVEFSISSADKAFVALQKGFIDMSLIALGAKEVLVMAEKAGGAKDDVSNYQITRIGGDRIRIAIHPENTVTALTPDQISGILEGKIKSWDSVGGLKIPIVIFLNKTFMAANKAMAESYLKKSEIPGANFVTELNGLVNQMKRDKGALALVPSLLETGDFQPKFFDTNAEISLSLMTTKNPKNPVTQKVFDYIKQNFK